MTPDSSAKFVLLIYLAIGAGIVGWRFRRSKFEPSTWFLWCLERFSVPFMFHWRANRRCPFPRPMRPAPTDRSVAPLNDPPRATG
jgi:hypothetical protein